MLHIYYGKGKGKTSAALGLILRAAGHGKKITLIQFLKPKDIFSGEHSSLKKLSNVKQIRFDQKHPIFMRNNKSKQIKVLKENINKSILHLKSIIDREKFDILVCDEILNLLNSKCLDEATIINLINKCRKEREIILTGRQKPNKLTKIADYITEFKLVKHPFQKGTKARKSIEY
jgi:cob(I)alamin adenosyltransferase